LLLSVLLTIALVPLLRPLALRLRMMDEPGGRKVHSEPIPRVGGIAMAVGIFVPVLLWNYADRDIFFDVPPVLAGADAISFAPLVDHILFVVQAEKSSMANVQKALGMLPKEKVLGIVLNRQADADATKYYY